MSFLSEFKRYEKCLPAGVLLPEVKIDEKHYRLLGLSPETPNTEFLRTLCLNGVKALGIDRLSNKEVYYQRLKTELAMFKELDFTDYILLTWDIINFCKESKIPTGIGRGSAAGSLVLYVTGVTGIDPIKHDLYFERFVSRARARKIEHEGVTYLDGTLMCDIDNDFSYERRQEVIDYIYAKYPDKAAAIMTFNTLSGKLCIKECAKIIDEVAEEEANAIAESIPKVFGKVMAFDKAVKESEKFAKWTSTNSRTFRIAKQLEGLIKNTSVHPSGIAVSHGKIGEHAPLSIMDDGHPIIAYDMDSVSELSVKVDILGLRTLSVVDICCKMLGIDWKKIDINDPSIYAAFQDLTCPKGIFQIEADTNFEVCRKVKPQNLQELSDVVALARPGALAFVDEYVSVKNGNKQIDQRSPELDDILKSTKGVIIYQESLMQIAHKVFKFTLEEAEILRRIVGKKKKDQVEKWEKRIFDRANELSLPAGIAEFYWNALNSSADYSFNLSHAVSYAYLAAITAYLKFNHPQEFFIALLKMSAFESKPHEEIRTISGELKNFDIKLLPPDLTKSKMDFSVDGKDIRYGLSLIKGVSEKTLTALEQFRGDSSENKFQIFIAAKDAGLNIGVLSALIQAGTLPNWRRNRSRLVLDAQVFNKLTDREKRNISMLGAEYDWDVMAAIKDCAEKGRVGDDGKKIIPARRFETIKNSIAKFKEIYALNSKYENFANWYFETKLLGYSADLRLKNIMGQDFMDSEDLPNLKPRIKKKFIGVVLESKKAKSAAGNMYIRMEVSDENGTYSVMLCDNAKSKKCSEYLEIGGVIPDKEDILVVFGSKSEDGRTVFAEEISVMTEKIYMKLSELKDEDGASAENKNSDAKK